MLDVFPQSMPALTGRPNLDAAINVGVCLASAGIYVASALISRRDSRRFRTRACRHTPFPVPTNRARKALDRLNGRG